MLPPLTCTNLLTCTVYCRQTQKGSLAALYPLTSHSFPPLFSPFFLSFFLSLSALSFFGSLHPQNDLIWPLSLCLSLSLFLGSGSPSHLIHNPTTHLTQLPPFHVINIISTTGIHTTQFLPCTLSARDSRRRISVPALQMVLSGHDSRPLSHSIDWLWTWMFREREMQNEPFKRLPVFTQR